MKRQNGTKNIMRTPEEKERLILEYRNSGIGINRFAVLHGISKHLFWKWINKYEEYGIEGLISNTGKKATGRPKAKLDQIEQLQNEILKLRIENERLKKGYYVKGDGARKEYVTSLEKNTK